MWCGVVWCGVVWCGVVWCGVVWCGVVWCGVVWCSVVWCDVVWCGVAWCGVVWCGGFGGVSWGASSSVAEVIAATVSKPPYHTTPPSPQFLIHHNLSSGTGGYLLH